MVSFTVCLFLAHLIKNTGFSKHGIYLKYEMWELLRHEKFLETHVLATLLTRNAWLFNGKKISCISGINKLFQHFQIFGDVCRTGLMAKLH